MKMPLQAPCIFCGYNGQGYWQSETHNEHCPLRHIGGEADREEFLRELFGSHRDCIARIAALEKRVEAADRMREFMSHTTECLFSSKPCFCGHDEVLAAYDAAKKGGVG